MEEDCSGGGVMMRSVGVTEWCKGGIECGSDECSVYHRLWCW